MKKTSETIVFFGSGPVAATSLKLLAQNFPIEAVITKPQPSHHKEPFPVLAVAADLNLKIFTPANKHELSALFHRKPATSKLGVVIDYGILITKDVIDYFPLGIVNSHFSLLPEWRGADPITFSILSGQQKTGVSLMLIDEKLDEGPLLAQAPYDIPEGMTTPQLTEALIQVSDRSLRQVLPLYFAHKTEPAPQAAVTMAASSAPTYSRKLTKRDGIIDWHKPAAQIEREIRAFIEWPKSHTKLGSTDAIITKAHAVPTNHPGAKPGDVETLKEGMIMVECGAGYLCIDRLKPAGKREMSAQAFLAGYRIT